MVSINDANIGNNQYKRVKNIVYELLEENNGFLRLKPTWVARKGFRSGRSLGLNEDEYNVGERGEITERWIGSTTKALNEVGPEDEGLSYIQIDNNTITLKEVIEHAGDLILGRKYSEKYTKLNILTKILSYNDRVYFHYHQKNKDAILVGSKSKEEAYYYPNNVPLGNQPESFFGFHPYITEQKKYDIILPYLIEWNSDLILNYSKGYRQTRDDGFHIPAGIPHGAGTALTIELQEDSDNAVVLQAEYNNKIISKDMLFQFIRDEDRKKFGERIILEQIDWEKSGDPYFYENRHTPPILIKDSIQSGGKEYWNFYNSKKFSGKRLIIYPGGSYISKDNGVYAVLVWQGKGTLDGNYIEANNFNYDELIVSHDKAVSPLKIKNSGNIDLEIFKFFGPDINLKAPMISLYGRK